MTIVEASFSAGGIVGSLLSWYVLRVVGNVYLLLIVASLNVVAYAFTNIWLRESLRGALKGGLSTILDFLLVKEMIYDCFKMRPNNGRAQILLIALVNTLAIFILYGMLNLDYLYTREKLHWSMKDYTIFSASSTFITFFGTLIVLLQSVLRLSDLSLAIFGFLTATIEYIIRIFAFTTWHMYLGASISFPKGISSALIRSYITKILPVEDISKVFVLMCAFEAVCPILAPIIYSSLYASTLETFPGSIYVFSAAITGLCIILLGVVQYYKSSSRYQQMVSNP